MKLLPLLVLIAFNTSAKDVVIHGKILNPIAKSISVIYSNPDVKVNVQSHGATINSNGTFRLSFPVINKYTMILLSHGDEETSLMVSPGDDIELNVDVKNFDNTLHYSGEAAAEANFIAKHTLTFGLMSNFIEQLTAKGVFTLDPDEFEKKLKEYDENEYSFINKNETGVSTDFLSNWRNILKYRRYYIMLRYPDIHEKGVVSNASINVGKDEMAIVRMVPFDFNDSCLAIEEYRSYMSFLFTQKAKASINSPADVEGKLIDSIALANADHLLPLKSREFFLAQFIYDLSTYLSYNDVKGKFGIFKTEFPHSKYLPIVENAVAVRKNTSAGMSAMDFSFTTIDGKDMKLSDFKGKVVYIFFWISWDDNSIRDAAFLNKVQAFFKNKPVVFLNISIDDNRNEWLEAVKKLHLEGVNVNLPGEWDSPVAKMYNAADDTPAYFLIDKNGKFAMNFAPRPTEIKVLEDINKLLQ